MCIQFDNTIIAKDFRLVTSLLESCLITFYTPCVVYSYYLTAFHNRIFAMYYKFCLNHDYAMTFYPLYVLCFSQTFAEEAEMVFKGSERRGDLDKAYTKLVSAQFKAIHRIAVEHQKTPRDVVMFENFHHLHAVLYRLKITVLENERKEAKQKYTEHLQLYVQESLGRPMDKLNVSCLFYQIYM